MEIKMAKRLAFRLLSQKDCKVIVNGKKTRVVSMIDSDNFKLVGGAIVQLKDIEKVYYLDRFGNGFYMGVNND